jgi:DNA-binding transcriptional LysR family regulator
MSDEFGGIAALLAVASRGSFTGAAADLGVTPSAVSQTVRALEDRLRVRLVERTTRSVRLTEAGERFIARAKPAIDEVRAALAGVAELRKRPSGTLRLTVPRAAYDELLEPMFTEFLRTYPEVLLEVSVDDGLVDIVERGFDAGVRLGESVERGMVGVQLTEERSAVVGSPSYFAQRPTPKQPRDLLGHECINFRLVTNGALYRWEFTEDGRDFQLAVRGRFVANDGAALLRAAERGIGLAYLLESNARPRIEQGILIRVLEAYCPPFPGFFIYYPGRANLPLKMRAFVDFAQKWRRAHRPKGSRRISTGDAVHGR